MATCLLATSALAQTERGNWMVGGSVSNLHLFTNRNSTQFSFSIQPSAGYFPVKGLAFGARPRVGYSVSRAYGETTRRTTTLGGALFSRYYIDINDRVKLPFELSYGINNFHTESTTAGDYNRWQTALGVYGGVAWFMAPNVSLELLAGYRRLTEHSAFATPSTGSLDMGVGFNVFLACKPKAE